MTSTETTRAVLAKEKIIDYPARSAVETKPWQRWRRRVNELCNSHILYCFLSDSCFCIVLESKTNSAIKRVKLATRSKAEEYKSKTPAEIGLKKNSKNEKVRRPIIAVGGLDHDMHDWSGGGGAGKSNKKAAQRDARDRKFSEFDPNKKLRKGGKLTKQSFKSKSKFKRRK